MAASLASLQTPLTQTQIFQILLGVYQAAGFPTSAWQTGGVERTRLMAVATAIHDVSANYIPAFANGLFIDTATSDGNGGGWLPLLAEQFYNLPQNAAISTQGTITLTSLSGVSAQTVAPGNLIVAFGPTGHRYINIAPIDIPAGPDSVNATVQAEFPGSAYADPSDGHITLVTPIPGVEVTNPFSLFTDVIHVGSGTGSLDLASIIAEPHSVLITITSTGEAGVATWSYAIDGSPAVSAGAAVSVTNLGGTGIDVQLVNGLNGTSFVLGDTYQFSRPGSWITQQGADIESDAGLRARLRNRWATLSGIPTEGYYELLASSTPGVGAQVSRVIVLVDPLINDQVNIIVAGAGGILPAPTLAAIQSFVKDRSRGCDIPVVQSPAVLNVSVTATVTVTAPLQSAIDRQIKADIVSLVNSAGINGTIRIASIIDTIMNNDGVVDVANVQINGDPTNLVLGGPTSFVLAHITSPSISYVIV